MAVWINPIDRIASDIVIPIRPILIPDGVSLQEPSKRWRVHAGFVVIDPEFGEPGLAGVLEPAGVGGGRDAIVVIAVDVLGGAGVAGDRDDRALRIGEHVVAVGGVGGRPVEPGQRLINPGAVEIAFQHGAAAVIFGNHLIAVIDEPAGVGGVAVVRAHEPAERIIEQRGALGAAGSGQPVLGVIAVGHAAIRGEIAIRIIGEVRRPCTRILVEAVGGIAAVDIEPVSERKAVVRQAARRDLPGRVIAKALCHVVDAGGAVEVVGQAAEAADRVIAVAGGGR